MNGNDYSAPSPTAAANVERFMNNKQIDFSHSTPQEEPQRKLHHSRRFARVTNITRLFIHIPFKCKQKCNSYTTAHTRTWEGCQPSLEGEILYCSESYIDLERVTFTL